LLYSSPLLYEFLYSLSFSLGGLQTSGDNSFFVSITGLVSKAWTWELDEEAEVF
jgi:hypothetical protein